MEVMVLDIHIQASTPNASVKRKQSVSRRTCTSVIVRGVHEAARPVNNKTVS